jgi:hypothetical protein
MAGEQMAGGNGTSALLDVTAARAALAVARGGDKLDLLLSAPDPVALVQALPEQDLYLALLEIGLDDGRELVSLASPSQFRHFIDMACWPARGEAGPDPSRVLRFLMLARSTEASSTAALERYRKKLAEVDSELLALVLRHELTMHDLGDDYPDPEPAHPGSTYRTPEGRYLIEFNRGDEHYPQLKALLDDLYAVDVLGTTRMLESLRWEVPTELEESERRWRTGRLRDQGIPELEEALSFYARPPRKAGSRPPEAPSEATAISPTGPVTSPPEEGPAARALATPQRGPPLLERALARLAGEESARAEEQIVYAANAAVVAGGAEPDDLRAVRDAIEGARATLSLGLELSSQGDEARAARVLAELPVKQTFQSAMAEVYRLQARARAVQKKARLPQAQSVTLLDPPLAGAVDALAADRPLFADAADAGPAGARRRPRALESRADVARAEALLDEAEATIQLLDGLGIGPQALGAKADEAGLGPAALRASAALRALALTQLRGEPFSLRELTGEERPEPEGFSAALDNLLSAAVASAKSPAAGRAAARLRALIPGPPRR